MQALTSSRSAARAVSSSSSRRVTTAVRASGPKLSSRRPVVVKAEMQGPRGLGEGIDNMLRVGAVLLCSSVVVGEQPKNRGWVGDLVGFGVGVIVAPLPWLA